MSENREVFTHISPADFFYRNRDLAGFSNPTRAIYSTIRELVENSLDACELHGILPEVYVRVTSIKTSDENTEVYRIRVEDNGSGIPPRFVPSSFGRILFGSKYKIKQVRGTFGLGGKMAILYGQITTNSFAHIVTSTGAGHIYDFQLMIDIQKNEPVEVQPRRAIRNKKRWHGTIVEFTSVGDYTRAMQKVLEYFKQTAIVNPYANITFVDPRGRLYHFARATERMPNPPQEINPHPYGVDIETIQRLVRQSGSRDLSGFLTKNFHRIGRATAASFLQFSKLDPKLSPKRLSRQDVSRIAQSMQDFQDFLPPDASCLSPLGEELFEAGIRKELNPEFVSVVRMPPSAYSGHPFIIELGIAYGGDVQASGRINLYRFANRIPLLYDESSDVIWKVVNEQMNWRRYKATQDMPIAVAVHVCSTKIPYKTVGKEFIADRPEIEKQVLSGIRKAARRLKIFLSRKISSEREVRRLNVFRVYLPKIARFSTALSGEKKEPDVEALIKSLARFGLGVEETYDQG